MTCSHIVECLRNKRIEPLAFASSECSSDETAAEALKYDTDTYYRSLAKNEEQWWAVDFKRHVSIIGYQINSGETGGFYSCLYNWTFYVSNDKITWKLIHGPVQNTSAEKTYHFEQIYDARYVKISGFSQSSTNIHHIRFYYVKFFGAISRSQRTCLITKRGLDFNLMKFILLVYS